MTVSGRAKSVRRNRRSASQMIVAGLVVLAVAASLFLIFSDSVPLLRVGLVIALWAATLGAIAMTKYRRESALDKAKVRDLQKVYELQLEREIGARREYELGVEARVRGELGAEAETIQALREELASLRRHLELLFDGPLPEDRVALRAESTRVQELVGSYRPVPSGRLVPDARPTGPRPSQQPSPRRDGFARTYDDPVTAETTAITPLDVEAVDDPAVPEAVDDPAVPEAVDEAPAVEAEPTVAEPEQPGPERSEPEPRPGSRRSRRLADDSTDAGGAHANGLSVAEILANLQTVEAGDGEPRRRRRAD